MQEPAHVAVQVASVELTVKVSAMHAGGLYMYIVIAEEADNIQYLYLTGNALKVYAILSMGMHLCMHAYIILLCQLYMFRRCVAMLRELPKFANYEFINIGQFERNL